MRIATMYVECPGLKPIKIGGKDALDLHYAFVADDSHHLRLPQQRNRRPSWVVPTQSHERTPE